MIHTVGQIMLYVNDQEASLRFWTEKAGFSLISKEDNGQGFRWFEIAPAKDSETSIVLHDKETIAKMSRGVNLLTPSIMFFTDNIDELYKDFSDKTITVGEMVSMPTGKVFNFADDEDNYFAVMEKKK